MGGGEKSDQERCRSNDAMQREVVMIVTIVTIFGEYICGIATAYRKIEDASDVVPDDIDGRSTDSSACDERVCLEASTG